MKRTARWIASMLMMAAAHGVVAAEFSVLSGGAIEPGLHAAAAAFERDTGHVAKITYNTAPKIRTRLADGEKWEVVIAPTPLVEEFAGKGTLTGERAEVGRVGIGIAVRKGAPEPDAGTPEALKRAILEADSVVFNSASSGIYLEKLLRNWGIYEQVQGRITRYPDGAAVMEHLIAGKGKELGFGASTEIALYKDKGLKLLAPLPAQVQNYTHYSAVSSGTAAARQFVGYLNSAAAKDLFAAAGVDR
jgi:molybdate transport system substrate-binding protein